MSKQQIAAVFDFDRTLTRDDSLLQFIYYLSKCYPLSALYFSVCLPPLTALYGLGLLSKEQMKQHTFRSLGFVPHSRWESLFAGFHRDLQKRQYLPRALAQVRWHREQGHLLVLASASVELYLRAIQQGLGFDILLGTPTTLQNGHIRVGTNCYAAEKVRRLQQTDWFSRIDWPSSFAYSDHPSDLPLLELCGHPVVANPSPALRQLAFARGWPIVDWK